MFTDSSERYTLLTRLADEFAARYRQGERPSLQEYINRYPLLADDIRDLFPAMVEIEQVKEDHREADQPAAAGPAEGLLLQQVGDYRILRIIGEGGMGIVYEAEQLSAGRRVAFKVPKKEKVPNERTRERFRREAKAAARLHHTNIVPIFDVGRQGDLDYYAMQLIQGQGLDEVIKELNHLRAESGTTRPAATVGGGVGPRGDEPVKPALSQLTRSLLAGQFAPPEPAVTPLPPTLTANPAAANPPTVRYVPAVGQPVPAAPAAGVTCPAVLPGKMELSDVETNRRHYFVSVARIGQQTALALAYAHARGTLHWDIKPANLLLDLAGVVWITDFGLAHTREDESHTGDQGGTLRYMSPERLRGQCDHRADIYALGLTLYELLVLKPAFDAPDPTQLREQILHQEPPRPRALDPRIPRDLEAVVLKAMARDPDRRYQTAEDLAEHLRCFIADEPIPIRRATLSEKMGRLCRRSPWVAGLSAAVLLLLTVTAVGGVAMSLRLNDSLRQTDASLGKAQEAEREGKRQLYASLASKAEASRLSGRAGQRFGTLETIRKAAALAHELEMPASTSDKLRDLAISALALPDIHLVKELDWPEGSRGPAFDSTLTHYARGDREGNISVRRLADDVEIASRSTEGPHVGFGEFDDDGRGLVLNDTVKKSREHWRFDAKEAAPLPSQPTAFTAEDIATYQTADKKLMVVLHLKSGVVAVHEAASGKHLHDIRFGKWAVQPQAVVGHRADMHPWDHQLALCMGDWYEPERGIVRILDLDEGTVQADLVTDPRMYVDGELSWHPDGRTLAVGYPQSVLLWDVTSRKPIRYITDHKGGGLSVRVSRSGQFMSTHSGWSGGVRLWHPYTGKSLLSLPSMSIYPTATAADGRLYIYGIAGERLSLHVTEPSPVLRVLVRNPARGWLHEYRRTSVHRNGRLLAVGSSGGVSLFDLSNGLDVGHLNLGNNLTAQFDPATGDLLTLGSHSHAR